MKREENIQKELIELGVSTLTDASREMPFAVPSSYFENFQSSINSLINIYTYKEPKLDLRKKMPFDGVPKGYFEGLTQQILNKVKSEPEWSKANPYQVPNGYFEHLPNLILTKVKEAENQESIRTKKIPLFRTVQLAASLALVIFVGLGALRMNHHHTNVRKSVAELTNAEIAQYVNDNIDDFDTDMVLNALSYDKATNKVNSANSLSIEEINNYLNEEGLN
jgi:hypothetical protein